MPEDNLTTAFLSRQAEQRFWFCSSVVILSDLSHKLNPVLYCLDFGNFGGRPVIQGDMGSERSFSGHQNRQQLGFANSAQSGNQALSKKGRAGFSTYPAKTETTKKLNP